MLGGLKEKKCSVSGDAEDLAMANCLRAVSVPLMPGVVDGRDVFNAYGPVRTVRRWGSFFGWVCLCFVVEKLHAQHPP